MRSFHLLGLFTAATVAVLCSCSESDPQPQPEAPPAETVLLGVVAASNYPLAYFAERIAEPLAEIRFPAAQTTDPAAWKPTPEDILALQDADLIFLNGASYESWIANVSLSPTKLIDTSAGFADQLLALDNVVTHSHGPEGDHEHSGTAFTTWLDLNLAAEQARSVKNALVARWPGHASHFEAQFGALAADLHALDAEIETIVAAQPGKALLFSHTVYQYFEHRYGLNGKSLHWEPHEMPDAQQWHEIEHSLRAHPAQWMLWEAQPLPGIVEKLETHGISSVVFSPCAGTPPDGDFFTVMAENIENLRRVFF